MARKILVVDDEPAVCHVLKDFLESRGYGVAVAYNGPEALEAYEKERPDVVLLDIRMPGMDGMEVLRRLKAFDPRASIIMVTAVHEEDIAKEALAQGAFEYITKPIHANYLEVSLMAKLALLEAED
jgi:CheY-like chemotaxis protein